MWLLCMWHESTRSSGGGGGCCTFLAVGLCDMTSAGGAAEGGGAVEEVLAAAGTGQSAGEAVRVGSDRVEADGSRTKIGVADMVLVGDVASCHDEEQAPGRGRIGGQLGRLRGLGGRERERERRTSGLAAC